MLRTLSALFTLALLLYAGTRVRAQNSDQQDGFPVRTRVQQGTLEGRYSTKSGVQSYLGVPFAKPPVGDLRWRAPQAPEKWTGVRQATAFGPRAVQKFLFDDMRFRSAGVSEDCLYLNVWTPATRHQAGTPALPVLFYIHGGGDVAGSGDEIRYDGEYLATQGIIVVTINYRLNVFGFLAHPELSAEAPYGTSGNYGMLDQVAALRWVKENIRAFGGDPDRITIAGESAGSMAVSNHMASPLSRNLFAGAVGQSGATMPPLRTLATPAEAEAIGVEFATALGAKNLQELRAASVRDIYEVYTAETNLRFPIVRDGHFLDRDLADVWERGEMAKVPLLVGWTSAEVAWLPPTTDVEFRAETRENYGSNTDRLLELYGPELAVSANHARAALASDNWIVHPTWRWSELHLAAGQPTYRYRFDRVRPPLVGQTRDTEPVGAGHASDIEYFMNTLAGADEYAWEATDRTVAETMSAALVAFVKTGRPGWPALGGEARRVMYFDGESGVKSSGEEERQRWWERYYGNGGR